MYLLRKCQHQSAQKYLVQLLSHLNRHRKLSAISASPFLGTQSVLQGWTETAVLQFNLLLFWRLLVHWALAQMLWMCRLSSPKKSWRTRYEKAWLLASVPSSRATESRYADRVALRRGVAFTEILIRLVPPGLGHADGTTCPVVQSGSVGSSPGSGTQ